MTGEPAAGHGGGGPQGEPVADGAPAAGGEPPGGRIVTSSWVGTAAFTVTSALGVAVDAARAAALVVALALFLAGCVLFLWAYAVAVGRSRTHEIGIGGLYFLAGDTAPPAVRWPLWISFAVQVAVALATASLALYTSLAFGVLAPVYGLGLMGLWAARYGSFGPRAEPSER